MVNVRLGDRAINTYLSPLFNPLFGGDTEKDAIDRLQCFGPNLFNVAVEGRFRGNLIGDAEITESRISGHSEMRSRI